MIDQYNRSYSKDLLTWRTFLGLVGSIPFINAVLNGHGFSNNFEISGGSFNAYITAFWVFISLVVLLLNFRTSISGFGIKIYLFALLIPLSGLVSSVFAVTDNKNAYFLSIPLIFLNLILLRPIKLEDFSRIIRKVAGFYIVTSLISMIIIPDWALEKNYIEGVISGLPIRLHGTTTHAINLAMIALLYLIIRMHASSNIGKSRLMIALALVVIILCQSKTAWIILSINFLFWVYRTDKISKLTKMLSGLSVFAFIFLLEIFSRRRSLSLSEDQSRRLETLTGRTDLWDTILDLQSENKFFGYGFGLFSENNRQIFLANIGWAPTHAHSQILQSLGETGYFGLLLLVIYLIFLLKSSLALSKKDNYIGASLVISYIVWSLSEPVFSMKVDMHFLIHFIIIAHLISVHNSVTIAEKEYKHAQNISSDASL